MTKTNPFLPLTGSLRFVYFFPARHKMNLASIWFCNKLNLCLCKLPFAQLDAKCSALNSVCLFHLVLLTILLNMGLLHVQQGLLHDNSHSHALLWISSHYYVIIPISVPCASKSNTTCEVCLKNVTVSKEILKYIQNKCHYNVEAFVQYSMKIKGAHLYVCFSVCGACQRRNVWTTLWEASCLNPVCVH